MTRRIVVLALLLLVAVPAAAASARRSVPPTFFGVNWDQEMAFQGSPAMRDAQFARMATAGVESVRTLFLWSAAQPEPDGPFNFSQTDGTVAAAAAHHLGVLPIVIDAPPWGSAFPSDFSPPTSPLAYTAYLTALIGRYGPHGSFWRDNPGLPRMPIRAWQIWNEPHLGYQWSTPGQAEDWAVRYALLLRLSHDAIKAADPGALVVLAGLANQSPTYLAHLYNFGIKPYFDVAAIHPYTATAAGVVTLTRMARKVMRRFGDGRKPIWLTEMGLPASRGRAPSSNGIQTTEGGMARFLSAVYTKLGRASRTLGVGRVYWYTWASSHDTHIGQLLFDFSGLEKWTPGSRFVVAEPAYAAYVKVARRLEGCVKTPTARCRRHR